MRGKKSLLFISLLIMINVLSVSIFPHHFIVSAEDDTEMGTFIIEKTWENDTYKDGKLIEDKSRPETITVHVNGSNGISEDYTLSASENWKKTVRLPYADSSNNTVTYTVYEKNVPEKYVSSADSEGGALSINLLWTGREISTFNVSESGFDHVPSATVRINPVLSLSVGIQDTVLPAGFEYSTNQTVYTNPEQPTGKDNFNTVAELLSYKGDLQKGDNPISGSVVLVWKNQAVDLSGNTYDVRMTISNITIHALAAMNKRIAIMAYNNTLSMQSYVADFTDNRYENIVGVRADIEIEVLGVPEKNYVKVILDDIDIADQVDHYDDKGTMGENDYFGLEYAYAESIVIKSNPASDVYVSNGKRYLVYNEGTRKFASSENINDSTFDNKYTTLEYLTDASSYSYTWAGSDCGTTIVMDAALPDEGTVKTEISNISSVYTVRYFYQNNDGTYTDPYNNPPVLKLVKPGSYEEVTNQDKTPAAEMPDYFLDSRDEYTKKYNGTTTTSNSAENPLTLDVYFRKENYVVRYFYQNDDGTYNAEPDAVSKVVAVPESSKVEASDADKTPAEDKPGYTLDKRDPYTVKWSGTTTAENYVNNPLQLDVYFKKSYVVIYHDNVGDVVWNPAVQTNPELDYGTVTPDYDTDLNSEGIQGGKPVRQGYDFVGWSETPDSEVFTVPSTVTKNADYWAHWIPGVNKYRVDYFYEVDGKYPSVADYSSADRTAMTEDLVSIIEKDKEPVRDYYALSKDMNTEWTGVVLPDGTLVLKVYFRQLPKPDTPKYTPPVTGVEH